MATWDELSANYLKAALLDPINPTTLTIIRVEPAVLDNGSKKRRMPLLFFKEDGWLPLALNSTNRQCMQAMFGPNAEACVGKQISLYVGQDRDPNTGKVGPCVRIWGSPSIPRDLTFDVKLPKKRPIQTTLRRTGGRQPSSAATQPPPEPARPEPPGAAEVSELLEQLAACTDRPELEALRGAANRLRPRIPKEAQAHVRDALAAAEQRVDQAADRVPGLDDEEPPP